MLSSPQTQLADKSRTKRSKVVLVAVGIVAVLSLLVVVNNQFTPGGLDGKSIKLAKKIDPTDNQEKKEFPQNFLEIAHPDLSAGSTRVTSSTAWPFQVLLKITKPSGSVSKCSGAILSTKFIITASHCVDEGVVAGNIQVTAGRVTETGSGGQTKSGKTIHMKNPTSTYCDDIALVELSSAFSFGASVGAINLPGQRVPDNTFVRIVGWGNNNYLTQGTMYTKAGSSCDPAIRNTCTVKEVCAQDNEGNVCFGDSGGPMFRRTTSGANYLQALTKRGSGLGCSDRTKDDIFTPVFDYKSWINGII